MVAEAHDALRGEDAYGAEHQGGSADRVMVRGMQAGVGQVAEDAGAQQQAPGEPRPEIATEGNDEDPAERQIAEQVQPVRVQSQGGDEPPPLTIQDFAGIGAAEGRPVGRVMGE